eukprot:TRINITY_DN15828_c0_g1_i2.p1 TRINITY_DN15828_c0_g1~~TRINITY_DN15828_c0_g1_i2.p1  ORF type:complete len:132 (+),score=39.72 TRINITY_DN15828_c0_g1_i2:129-524(+)
MFSYFTYKYDKNEIIEKVLQNYLKLNIDTHPEKAIIENCKLQDYLNEVASQFSTEEVVEAIAQIEKCNEELKQELSKDWQGITDYFNQETYEKIYDEVMAVSYTHLTLPTKRIVQISVDVVSLKKKKITTE